MTWPRLIQATALAMAAVAALFVATHNAIVAALCGIVCGTIWVFTGKEK